MEVINCLPDLLSYDAAMQRLLTKEQSVTNSCRMVYGEINLIIVGAPTMNSLGRDHRDKCFFCLVDNCNKPSGSMNELDVVKRSLASIRPNQGKYKRPLMRDELAKTCFSAVF